MPVSLTVAELRSFNACHSGIEFFRSVAGDEELVIDWTEMHALWLAIAYPDEYIWLANRELIPPGLRCSGDLSGADLTDAYLGAADLRGCNLAGADLTGAYLVAADLRGANLRGARLTCAYVAGARFDSGVDISAAYGGDLLRTCRAWADGNGRAHRKDLPDVYTRSRCQIEIEASP